VTDIGNFLKEGRCVGVGATQATIRQANDGIGSANLTSDSIDFVKEWQNRKFVW
jgi:hypothetical protein